VVVVEKRGAIGKIARGTGIVFAGTVVAMLLNFFSRALLARHFDRYHYGSFTLTTTIISIAVTVALLGFSNGLPREVSHYIKRDPERVDRVVSTGLLLSILSSIITAAFLILLSPSLARLLKDDLLSENLNIAAFAVPFIVILMVLVGVSRGYGRVRENFYYRNISQPLLFLALIAGGILLGEDFSFVFVAYLISWALPGIVLAIESYLRGILPRRLLVFEKKVALELLVFSLPLMLTGILDYVMGWTDSIMLGYYYGPERVGLYNGAAPIARVLPVFLNSMGFIYMPIATAFYTEGDINGLERIYRSTTKWAFLLTLPLFLTAFAFPRATILLVFGRKYVEASTALRILSIGFTFHVAMGLNAMTLLAIGRTYDNLVGNALAAALNIILNLLLIPIYGINGAAVATAVSYIGANIYRTWRLRKETGIHPFGGPYIKALLIGGITVAVTLLVGDSGSVLKALVTVVLTYALFLLAFILSGCIEDDDVKLLEMISKRTGLNLVRILAPLMKRN
jgi:O-antigen/teichoic acid export membrane protein